MDKSITLTVTSIMVIFLCASIATSATTNLYEIAKRSVKSGDGICKSMVDREGYVCHEHTVSTKDGYILGLVRMPKSRSGKKADKPPVLLQHGLLTDGGAWLVNTPDESLGFILADNGYDVWIANTRGTTSSQGHTLLRPEDPAYWNWTWDELVEHDLSTVMQYVHDQTGQKLHYVGHSQGTLMALAAFSENKLLSMIRSAALLSPIAYLNQIPFSLTKAAAYMFLAEELYWLGELELIPGGMAASKLIEKVCDSTKIDCSSLIVALTGPNCCVNTSRVDEFLDHEPQPTATKNLVHLSQMIRTGNIAKYDYGTGDDNMKHYGQPTPPRYDMTRIPKDFPLFLAYGGQDTLSDIKDVQVLLDNLKDHDGDQLVVRFLEDYAHADFVFSVNANRVIYHPIMAFFKLNN